MVSSSNHDPCSLAESQPNQSPGLTESTEYSRQDVGNPSQLDLRILVPCGIKPFEQIGREIKEILLELCDVQKIVPGSFNIFQTVQAPYEDTVAEVHVSVIPEASNRTLKENAELLISRWCSTQIGLEGQARLQILNREAFTLDCIPCNTGIPVAAVSVGTMLNWGTFAQHYIGICDQRNGAMDMWAEFLHDKRVLEVKILVGRKVGFKLMVPYSGIHSIVVDAAHKNEYRMYNTENLKGCQHIYFQLRWPPQVWKKYPKTFFMRGEEKYTLNLNQFFNFFRSPAMEEIGCSKEVIGNSSVLCLAIPPPSPYDTFQNRPLHEVEGRFFEILGRLRAKIRTNLNFSAVKQFPVSSLYDTNGIDYPDLGSDFPTKYAYDALISRGFIVTDHLRSNTPGQRPLFLRTLEKCVRENPEASHRALEQILHAVDERKNISLLRAFHFLYKLQDEEGSVVASEVGGALFAADLPPGCCLIRKVVLTPTRSLFFPPEVLLSNRVIRKFREEYALRLTFRDEDGRKLHNNLGFNNEGKDLLRRLVTQGMGSGVTAGGRHFRFLAWSNSQLRDHGCYLFANRRDPATNTEIGVEFIRKWMGDFTAISCVPKLMSRMGQCFTQAHVVECNLEDDCYVIEEDITGGEGHPETGEPYVFSDGIGRMSHELAVHCAKKLEINYTPSAFQVRFAGCKGMLSVDPYLAASFPDKTNIRIAFRESMEKFKPGPNRDLEVVKYSQPSPVYLNRPLINIIIQVAKKQGTQLHQRIAKRIHEIVELELFKVADMLLSEKASAQALTDRLPVKVEFRKLRQYGFALTKEPFMRSLLQAVHRYNIKEQIHRAKIEIPGQDGRTAYGVIDETGILQYGQVMFQYSKKLNSPHEDVQIAKGKVLMTKNPCIVPGDVRVFEAVYVEALSHMIDVIIFPQFGPRPHTDEMAGSDLDGDEYCIFFDPDLRFERNEFAMTFPRAEPETLDEPAQPEDMIQFFLNFITQDSVGILSNAHLCASDRYGIFNDVCMSIARKCSMAVDFPKTGIPAEGLEGEEKSRKFPDYFQKDHKPCYRSSWITGQIFRKTKKVEDILELGCASSVAKGKVTPDIDLALDGWERFEESAQKSRGHYTSHIQALIDTYGIADEASLVSGHMVTMKNRVSDQDKDDYSFYNTEKLVELRYGKLFNKFRIEFFSEFGGEPENLDVPSPAMLTKASAWYMVSYDASKNPTGYLSLPWIVWDLLAHIKRRAVYGASIEKYQLDPVREEISTALKKHGDWKKHEVDEMMESVVRECPAIGWYCKRYRDLPFLAFALIEWSRNENLFHRTCLRPLHIFLLLVQFGRGTLQNSHTIGPGESRSVDQSETLYLPDEVDSESAAVMLNEEDGRNEGMSSDTSRGSYFLSFLRFLAAEQFRRLPSLSFKEFQVPFAFCNSEWKHLHQIAFKAYHRVALASNVESLFGSDKAKGNPSRLSWDYEESEPITVELKPPSEAANGFSEGGVWYHGISDSQIEQLLKEKSGASQVRIHREFNSQEQARILCAGSIEARHRLRNIVTSSNFERCLHMREVPEEAEDF